ncbi:MAG: hypothetical protein LBG12_09675 [Synergistaceae bacterium]|jgi:hypothetical protein|nr:hypothetical protein [Synergistaceae bacterium]
MDEQQQDVVFSFPDGSGISLYQGEYWIRMPVRDGMVISDTIAKKLLEEYFGGNVEI